jgi:hypothetical protein
MTNYFKKTWKNKLVSVLLFFSGCVPIWIDGDGTAFVFLLMFAIPLFFAKNNYIKF